MSPPQSFDLIAGIKFAGSGHIRSAEDEVFFLLLEQLGRHHLTRPSV
jgi:hypothetical protein